ncbi:hypothetical protein T492DRAFT_1039291 [Pavlovales sp. CCMP2436]|nr:hypothetical protein T492DRAFT_1039291 [Pavlovales sp. CCMP2436]
MAAQTASAALPPTPSPLSEAGDLGAGWGGQQRREQDEHFNHPTNAAIREATTLKETGNAAFSSGDYDAAVGAYTAGAAAAAEVEGSWRSKVALDLQTACLCNGAQARLKQTRWPEAAELCTLALKVDGKCVKALFRRGCAYLELKDYAQARRDLELAAEVEPKNTIIADKLVDVERIKMSDAKKSKGANNYERFEIDLLDDEEDAKQEAKPSTPSPPPSAPPKPAAATKPAATPAAADPIADEEKERKPASGYRYWSKSPSAPRVIAQKIDPAALPAAVQPAAGSVWNAAGTYEEKDQTEWARGCLTELLGQVALELVEGGSVRCTAAKGFQGDAGIHTVRGKKRFLFDLKFSVPFELTLPGCEQLFSGEVEVLDFSTHDQSDWESKVSWDAKPPAGPLYSRACAAVGKELASPAANTLCAEVAKALASFVATFKER